MHVSLQFWKQPDELWKLHLPVIQVKQPRPVTTEPQTKGRLLYRRLSNLTAPATTSRYHKDFMTLYAPSTLTTKHSYALTSGVTQEAQTEVSYLPVRQVHPTCLVGKSDLPNGPVQGDTSTTYLACSYLASSAWRRVQQRSAHTSGYQQELINTQAQLYII